MLLRSYLVKMVAVALELAVLIAVVLQGADAYDKYFVMTSGVRLTGCLRSTLENVPTPLLCTQSCVAQAWKCQSVNFFPLTSECELNSCAHASGYGFISLENNADSKYYESKATSAADCQLRFGAELDTCHPVGTASCTAGGYDLDGKPMSRVCNCYSFASSDDCSVVSSCTLDGFCFELQTTPAALSAAKSICSNLGGLVFTEDSHAEMAHIKMYLQIMTEQPPDLLLGVEYYANYQDFAFSSNLQPLSGYQNWNNNSDPTTKQPCVKLSVADDFTWVNVACDTQLQYICEVPDCLSGFRKYNGSCYNFDSGARYWDDQTDYCHVKDERSRIAWISYKEENDYMKGVFNSEWGAGYPIVNGLHDWYEYQTFRWIHNDWIPLDWNVKYIHKGCYNDDPHLFDDIEGSHGQITDAPSTRSDPITKCYYASRDYSRNYRVFGVQHGGTCRSSADAHLVYADLGATTGCIDGEGVAWKNDIYESPNRNLFYDFAFQSTGWNDGTRVYFWWHGDSWRWHDAHTTTSGRAVCKVETCPQGFAPHANKCFKIIDKKLPRHDARDECQRYTGADLYNPEYPDEAEFILNMIENSDISTTDGRYYWTGVYDELEDGSQKYEVLMRPVNDNYNVYPLGAEPIYRESLDGAADVTMVEMRYPFPSSGKVVGWEYYSGRAGTPLKFSVLRAEGELSPGNCPFYVVGINSYTSGSNYQRIDVPEADRISVKAGDYIAMTFTGASNVRYNGGFADENFCTSHNIMATSSGTSINLEQSHRRTYSFRALWIPDGFAQVSPFHLSSAFVFNGGQCFYADRNYGLRIRDLSCTTTYYSICEIKRHHRHSSTDGLNV